MSENMKRLLAFVMAATMVFSMLPMTAGAEVDSEAPLVPEESVGQRDPKPGADATEPESSEPDLSADGLYVTDIVVHPTTIYENYCGEYYNEAQGYYHYYWWNRTEVTVYFSDGGSSTIYACNHFEYNGLQFYVGTIDDQSAASPWIAGYSYDVKVYVDYEDQTLKYVDAEIMILPNPIRNITVQPIEMIGRMDGGRRYDWNEEKQDHSNEWWCYDWWNRLHYTVEFTNGDVCEFTDFEFYYGGERFRVDYYDDQRFDNQWEVGNTYQVRVRIAGVELEVPVTIKQSPVQNLTFSSVEIIENTCGNRNEGYYQYNLYEILWKTTYTATADGGELNGKSGSGFWYNNRQWDFQLSSNQSATNQWQAGETYYIDVEVCGTTGQIAVTIKESPAVSLSIEPVVLYENTQGGMATYEDETGMHEYWNYSWYYAMNSRVEFNDGSMQYCSSGLFYQDEWYSFECTDTQSYDTPWTVGNTYYVEVSFMGLTTVVPVTIKEMPIKKITAQPVYVQENTSGYWCENGGQRHFHYYAPGNISFEVEFKDGTKVQNSGWSFWYQGENYSITMSYYQPCEEPWLPDNVYTMSIDVREFGISTELPIYIYRQEQSDDFVYMVQNGQAIIINYYGDDEILEIPATLNDYPVVGITGLGEALYCAKEIIIPDSVTMLAQDIFYMEYAEDGIRLEKLTLGAGVSEFDASMLTVAKNLNTIAVSANNPNFTVVEGVLYNKDVTALVAYPPAKTELHKIPDSVADVSVIFDNLALYSNIKFQLGAGVQGYVMENGVIYNEDKTQICYVSAELSGAYVMPNTVEVISEYAFANTNITELTLSSSVVHIAYAAFADCKALEKVNLPEGLQNIGGYSFAGCSNLKEVNIPSSVWLMNEGAFAGASKLEKVQIVDLPKWCQTLFDSEDANPLYYANNLYLNGQLIQELVLPSVVDRVYAYAFVGGNFRSVTVPATVYRMDYMAFDNCNELTAVYTPSLEAWCAIRFEDETSNPLFTGHNLYVDGKQVQDLVLPTVISTVYEFAFNGANIKTVTVPDNVYYIGAFAFRYSEVESVSLSQKLQAIEYCAFQDTNLTTVVMPDTVTYLGTGVFADCTELASVRLSENLTMISSRAFQNTALTTVTIPAKVEWIDYRAFKDSKLTSVDLQCESVVIGEQAFMNCPLGDLVFDENVDYIDWQAFQNTSATQVVLPNGITEITYRSFGFNGNLVSVTIPDSVEMIHDFAFEGSNNLNHVLYTGSEEQWYAIEQYMEMVHDDLTIHFNAEGDEVTTQLTCTKVVYECSICGEKGAVNRKSAAHQENENGVCTICGHYGDWEYDVEDDTITIIGYSGKESRLEIPSTINGKQVVAIAANAFINNNNLISVTIPGSVKTIGASAFEKCVYLETVKLNKGLTQIGKSAFANCRSLTAISIPEGVTEIAEMAFYCNESMKSLELPKGLKTIGEAAFEFCWRLQEVVIPEGVERIDHYAFRECHQTKEIVLPSTVTQIGYFAFECCCSLGTVTIPESVNHIQPGAFNFCSELETVFFKGNAPEIYSTFYGVNSVVYYPDNTSWSKVNLDDVGNSVKWVACPKPSFTVQPENVEAELGDKVGLDIEAVGVELTYQWYKAEPDSKRFVAYDGNPALVLTEENSGTRFYCVVTDILGQTGRTKTATLKVAPSMKGIAVAQEPYTVNYDLRQELRLTGLEVVEIYSDGSEVLITEGYTVAGYDPNVGGEQTVTVTYGTYTAEFKVFVNEEKLNYVAPEQKIEISVPENAVEEGAQLVVEEVQLEEEEVEVIPEIIQQNEAVVFDISFQKDEEVVQPSEVVQVSIPVPENMDKKGCKVFHVADDGTVEDMNAVYSDGRMVFETPHFSYYAIVQTGDKTISGTVSGDDLFGVVVKLLVGREVVDQIEIGDDGAYTFENLEDNTYTVAVEKEDMKTKVQQVIIAGADQVLDFLLAVLGDITGDENISIDDVIRLLLHVTMPDEFEIESEGDINGNGTVNIDDVIRLLLHVTMPDEFPLE